MKYLKKKKILCFIMTALLFAVLLTPTVTISSEHADTNTDCDFNSCEHYSSLNLRDVRNINQTVLNSVYIADSLGLTDSQIQSLKKDIHNAVANRRTNIDISKYYIPYDLSITNLLISLIGEDPGNIAADVEGYYSYKSNNMKFYYAIQVSYYSDSELTELKNAADKLLEGLESSDLSDAEKALLVHDRLAVNCKYDTTDADKLSPDCYRAYGALVNKNAVCEGYAKAYMYLMNRLSIQTEMATSKKLNHAWNIVTIDGERYHVDVSHDDTIPDLLGQVYHEFFLVSTGSLLSSGSFSANDYDSSPQSTLYDNAPWTAVDSNFILFNNSIYYISKDSKINRLKNEKTESVLSLLEFKDSVWHGDTMQKYWNGFFGMLSCDDDALYFNLAKNIYRYTPGEDNAKIFYTPKETEESLANSIFRFIIQDNVFCYILSTTPNGLSSETITKFNYKAYFIGLSATLDSNIEMNFLMNISEYARTDDAYLEFRIDGLGGKTSRTDLSSVKPDANGNYVFSCPVNILQLADTITAEYHYNENIVIFRTSVSDYIIKIEEKAAYGDNDCIRAKPLVEALADFSYFAQKSLADKHGFKIGEDHKQMILFNSAPDIKADLSAFSEVQYGFSEDFGADTVSQSLLLDSKTGILLIFDMKENRTLSESDVVCKTDHPTSFTRTEDGNYLFNISDICASELDKPFHISIQNDTWTLDFSPLSYAYNVLSSDDTSANDKNTCAALYKYYLEAKNYLKKIA